MNRMTASLLCICLFVFSAFGNSQDKQLHDDIQLLEKKLRDSEAAHSLTVDSKAHLLGNNVIDIIEFVRNEIVFQHYSGILRGGEGTLSARAGNSFDQAILLHRMLRNARVDAELWRGVLAGKWAARLLARDQKTKSYSSEAVAASLNQNHDIQRAIIEVLDNRNSLIQKVDDLSKALEKCIPSDLIQKTMAERPDPGPMDYMWVRIRREEGFVDIHPCFNAEDAVEVREIAYAEIQTSLPPELYHMVRVRLIAERPAQNGFGREILLERIILPMAMTGKTAKLTLDPVLLKSGSIQLTPSFRFGDTILAGESRIYPFSSEKPVQGSITALFVETTVITPSAPPQQQSIALFDLLEGKSYESRMVTDLESRAPLKFDDFRFSCDILVMGGPISPLHGFINMTRQMRRLSRALVKDEFDVESVRFAIEYNPVLITWASLYSQALFSQYNGVTIEAPLTILAVNRIENNSAVTSYYLEHLNLAATDSPLPGLSASLLLAELVSDGDQHVMPAEIPFSIVSEAGKEQKLNMEMEDELLRGSDVAANDHGWWLSKPKRGNQLLLHNAGKQLIEKRTKLYPEFTAVFPHVVELSAGSGNAKLETWKDWLRSCINSVYLSDKLNLPAHLLKF